MAMTQCSVHGVVERVWMCAHLGLEFDSGRSIPYFIVFESFGVAVCVCSRCVRLDWAVDERLLDGVVLRCFEHFSEWSEQRIHLRFREYLAIERIRQRKYLSGDNEESLTAEYFSRDGVP
jgi:hypothetical protein